MIFIEDLRPGMTVAQDVYTESNSLAPLIKAGTKLTVFMISRLKERGVRFLYLGQKVMPTFENNTTDIIPRVPPRKPVLSTKLRDDALESLKDAFDVFSIDNEDIHESSKAVIGHIDHVVGDLVTTISTEKNALVNINDLKSYDDYTFHHSLSVAVLSVAIGQEMGYSKEQLHQIGMCAMMHDIGKTAVPIEIIHKKGRLDDAEFSIVKTHSPAGFEFLKKSLSSDSNVLQDDNVLQGVLHHHEKFDGTGYPDGLKGIDIPAFSRIISIADVYDALTSSRPYRTPMQPFEAVEHIMGGAGSAFDFDMVSAFTQKVELYPVGSYIELSNGKIGVVIGCENQLRPVVRTIDGEVLDLFRDRKCLNIVVKQLLPYKNVL